MKRWPAIIALAVMAAPVTAVASVALLAIVESWKIRRGVLEHCEQQAGELGCIKPAAMLSVADSWVFGLVALVSALGWWAAWQWIWLRKAPPSRRAAGSLAIWFVALLAASTVYVSSNFSWM